MSRPRHFSSLLQTLAAERPDALAAVDAHGPMTFAQLDRAAGSVAAGLAAHGARRGSLVGLLGGNTTAWLAAAFGSWRLGATVAPFSTWSTEAELSGLLADAKPGLVLVEERFRHQPLGRLLAAAGLAVFFDTAQPAVESGIPPDDWSEDVALLLHTSGSSSRPKSVPLLHHDLIENGFAIGERQGLTDADRIFLPAPLFWAYGSANALTASFSHGAALVLQDRFEAAEALDLIERHQCTAIYTLPTITDALIAAPSFAPCRTASLRTGLTLGSPLEFRRAVELLGVPELCNIYGSTEVYGNCCVTPHDWPLDRRAVCQGPPLPGVRLRIVDSASGQAVADGETGLVEVKGHVTPGYRGPGAAENAKSFTADGYFRTGDSGHLLPDGSFVFDGRLTEMIKRAGINVSPVEVEEALRTHADVREVCVTGVPDPARGEIIVAFVVPSGKAVEPDAMRAHCATLLSKYKLPDRILAIDRLPTTNTGKVSRRSLRDLAVARLGAEA